MKKSVIKRRKRVIPATHEHSPVQSHLASVPRSISSDSQHTDTAKPKDTRDQAGNINPDGSINLGFRSRGSDGNLSNHHRGYQPPPIDFTGYQVDRPRHQGDYRQELQRVSPNTVHADSTNVPSTQPPVSVSSTPPRNTRKRSLSIAEGDSARDHHSENARSNRLSSISSILNPAQQIDGDNVLIDPSLTAIDRDHYHQQQHQNLQHQPPPASSSGDQSWPVTVDDPGGKERLARRAQLQREAEEMREMLKAKERELAELSGEG